MKKDETASYQDDITFVAEHIIKIRYSEGFTEKEIPCAEQTAAYSAAYILGYDLKRGLTKDLIRRAFIESNVIRFTDFNDINDINANFEKGLEK